VTDEPWRAARRAPHAIKTSGQLFARATATEAVMFHSQNFVSVSFNIPRTADGMQLSTGTVNEIDIIWYNEDGTKTDGGFGVPNAIDHPSRDSVPTSYYALWHYVNRALRWMFSAASVCLSVCLFVNTVTFERLHVGR